MATPENRVALVTGASSGIGQACAGYLAERGLRVYGTSRAGAVAASASQGTAAMLRMDVTLEESIASAVAAVLEREGRLDIVVNNAGIAVAGPLESTPLEAAKRQLDVNFFGAVRVCRAVLPVMRRQRSGWIVNIGSIGGLVAIPYQAHYSASKFALEGMSEALRLEVRPLGIRVVLIEPGDTRTGLTENRRVFEANGSDGAYASLAAAVGRMAEDEKNGIAPGEVARLVWRIVNHPNPRLRYTAGPPLERAAVWLKRFLPHAALEYGMRRYYRLR